MSTLAHPQTEPDQPRADDQPPTGGGTRRGRSTMAAVGPQFKLVLALLVVALVLGVYQMGRVPAQAPSATSGGSPTASAGMTAGVDQKSVTELKAKVASNPRDVTAMRNLGKVYYQGEDFANAAVWQKRILDLNPNDVDALLGLGVATFSQGDVKAAKAAWTRAARLDPKIPEVHYNLGFLYLTQTPPSISQAEKEWQQVQKLAPGTDLAKTVAAHLKQLKATATPSAKTSK